MILDQETNLLYIADTLDTRFPNFHQQFRSLLKKHKIEPHIIPHTNDVWCRDYMPVQVRPGKMIGFVYNPDYLQPEKYMVSRSDNKLICDTMGLKPEWSDIVLDGGNVIRWKNKVIATDKIYKENPTYGRKELREKLRNLLEIDELVVIPRHPYDFTGHADGMVRFLDEHTVLVSDFSDESQTFRDRLTKAFARHKLNVELLPNGYEYPTGRKNSSDSAQGIYINYLHIGNLIVLSEYWLLKDEEVYNKMRKLYPNATIETINCNGIAEHGGVLNCITWTIKQD